MNKTILLIEDEENDIFFLKRAFKAAGVVDAIQVVQDGDEALDYLGGSGKYADRERFPLPSLALLDLKLPCMMGLEVLGWIRGQSSFKSLIVIILTSSGLKSDVETAYQLGANAYLVKPSTPHELREIARKIKQFWLELNETPESKDVSLDLDPCFHG